MFPTPARSGFTMIEMLVATTILIIIAGIGIAGTITFNQNQGIEDDSKEVLTELRRVYSRAAGVYYPPGCNGTLTGYTVSVTSGSSNVVETAKCASNIAETRTDVIQTSHFSTTVSFTINAGDGKISGSPYTLTIVSNSNSGLSKQIQVSDYGVFELL